MNTDDDFETLLSRQPFRPPRAEWKADILRAAASAAVVAYDEETTSTVQRRTRRSSFGALLWPSPYAWSSLAAVWLVLLAFKLDTPAAPMLAEERSPMPPSEFGKMLAHRQEEIDALLAMTPPPLREKPSPTPPHRSSDPWL